MPNYLAGLTLAQRTPLDILREAADALKKETGGLVGGTVSTLNPGGGTQFRYTFYLLVPSLSDYTDPLFYAWHGLDFYPVKVLTAGGQQGQDDMVCHDDTELENELARIFDSNETTKRIRAMIALAQ